MSATLHTEATTGSQAAEFRALFEAHAAFVWRVLKRHGVAEADLEDVCQEVFIVVHTRLTAFEGRSSVRTWIYAIARNSAAAQRRKTRRHDDTQLHEETLVDPCAGPDAEMEQMRARQWLQRALAVLSDDQREAFVLVELEEMSLKDAAEALGCGITTVHYRVTLARRAIATFCKRAALAPMSAPSSRPQVQKDSP